MTDAEILKALECCANEDAYCEDCPSKQCCDGDTFGMIQAVLDLISRQKAEIERLQKQEGTVAKLYHKKGIKDVAKRVREEINFPLAVWKVFDKIIKELGGDTENGEKKD